MVQGNHEAVQDILAGDEIATTKRAYLYGWAWKGRVMKVNVLGTDYEIITKSKVSDVRLNGSDGLCDGFAKKIIISDLSDYVNDPEETKAVVRKVIYRHEIVHAFLNESGLNYDANVWNQAWSKNEEMVDWIAFQFPKILKAFQEVDCL